MKLFEQKTVYCTYYRVKIESFPARGDCKLQTDLFVYRTPSGYNQEFIKHDLGILLSNTNVMYSKDCDVKPLQPLTVRSSLKIQHFAKHKKFIRDTR